MSSAATLWIEAQDGRLHHPSAFQKTLSVAVLPLRIRCTSREQFACRYLRRLLHLRCLHQRQPYHLYPHSNPHNNPQSLSRHLFHPLRHGLVHSQPCVDLLPHRIGQSFKLPVALSETAVHPADLPHPAVFRMSNMPSAILPLWQWTPPPRHQRRQPPIPSTVESTPVRQCLRPSNTRVSKTTQLGYNGANSWGFYSCAFFFFSRL